jgi:radical SAM protein with 4Fe4S-binding SPASM domain
LPPGCIRITLYAGSEEGYLRCTGRPAFARVVENIRRLKDAGLPVKLAMTLSRYNVEEWQAMCRVAEALDLEIGYAIDLFPADPDSGRKLEDYQLSPEEMLKTEIALQKDADFPFFQNEPLEELPQQRMEGSSHGMVCGAGRISYCVNWDGCMSLCVGFPGVASLREMSLAEAWKRLVQVSDDYVTPVECNTCKLRPACTSCPVSRCDPKDPGHCNPQRCEITRMRYNAGLVSLDPNTTRQKAIPETEDGFC